jgi:hypothetical protein
MLLRALALPVLAAGLLAATAATASADTLVTAAPGARNLTANGGYQGWAAPAAGRLLNRRLRRLRLRPGRRQRAEDRQAGLEDLQRDRAEHRARTPRLRAPRRRPQPGLYYWSLGSSSAPRRLSTVLARETATNSTRVAYTYNSSRGGGLAVRLLSGHGSVLVPVSRQPAVPRSPLLTRYNAAWLLQDGHVQATRRLAGSGGPFELSVVDANRTLPASTDSIGLVSDRTSAPFYLDAEGVKLAAPALF